LPRVKHQSRRVAVEQVGKYGPNDHANGRASTPLTPATPKFPEKPNEIPFPA